MISQLAERQKLAAAIDAVNNRRLELNKTAADQLAELAETTANALIAWQAAQKNENLARAAMIETDETLAELEAEVEAAGADLDIKTDYNGNPVRCLVTGLPVLEGDALAGDDESYCVLLDVLDVKDGYPRAVTQESQ